MHRKKYKDIKLKFLVIVSGIVIALAGLIYWHVENEYHFAAQPGVNQTGTFDVLWLSTVYSEVIFVGLLMLLFTTLFFIFMRQVKRLETANLELNLQQAELTLKAEMLDSTLDAILLLDEKGRLLKFNNALCSLVGRYRSELEGMRIQDFMPPEKADKVEKRIQLIQSSGSAIFESEYLHKSGKIVPIEGNYKSVEISGRKLILSVVRDISEQKKYQRTLENAASEWRDTFDSVEDVIWVLDINRKILRSNQANFTMFGKTPKEIIGLDCHEAAHCRYCSEHGCPFEEMMDTRKHVSTQITYNDKWLEVTLDPVFSSDGKVTGAVHIIKDITALKRSERSEQARAEILEKIAGDGPLPQTLSFIALAIEKEIPGALCSILLVDDEGEYLTNCVSPSLPDAYKKAISRVKIGEGIGSCGTAAYRRERVVVEDINTHPFWEGFVPAQEAGLRSCLSEPVFCSNGELLGTFAIYQRTVATYGKEQIRLVQQAAIFASIAMERSKNAQEREQLEQLLSQSQKMEAIGHLAGGVAHDFNNLLTPIIIYSDMLKRSLPEDEKLHSKIDGIIKASHKARDLTQQLLSFGRKQVMQMQVQNLNEIITSFFSILRRTLRENIDIKLQLAEQPAMVSADRSKIEQVLLNLAINAQDATEGNGAISLETGQVLIDDEYARLHPGMKTGYFVLMSFRDNGSGMNDETMRHIFEPFFTTKQVGHGTGLGLANVYGIVKQHNAYISALSKPGNGTTFNIYFPLSSDQPNYVEQKKNLLNKKHGGGGTILLVEDNEMVRVMARDLLESHGYTVIVADHPEKALEIVRHSAAEIDLVITDVVMPGMNGKQLFEQITTDYPRINKVLYMSGYSNNIIVTNGVLEEGLHFLQKPFTDESLMSKIQDLMNPEQ